ncbi:hypothetical protein F4779DRAFT_37495 [Xylariaceae sp. FL0662B]|nr:hypothetical protein F4779DRAFT_37495 [Xylariaceae sp. FL0662B]
MMQFSKLPCMCKSFLLFLLFFSSLSFRHDIGCLTLVLFGSFFPPSFPPSLPLVTPSKLCYLVGAILLGQNS